jgi:uncharacterized protein YheU (UPF0270 family)
MQRIENTMAVLVDHIRSSNRETSGEQVIFYEKISSEVDFKSREEIIKQNIDNPSLESNKEHTAMV